MEIIYRTSDGTEFKEMAVAEAHEEALNMLPAINEWLTQRNLSAKKIAEYSRIILLWHTRDRHD